jgi:diacylglycerol O-acyltransferase / wax synthase
VKERTLTRRLSPHDSLFLYWEHPEQPMHVAECLVYDGRFSAADLVQRIEERMHLLPRYRQKVVFPPLAIAHPTWEDDPDFAVANHVDEMDLPAPADDIVLSRVGGELFCRLLDRDRPLWHATVLQGHEKGTVVFLKLHHSMVDGVSSIDLLEVLHGTAPDASPPPPPTEEWEPKPVPGPATLLRDAIADDMATLTRGALEVVGTLNPSVGRERLKRFGGMVRTLAGTAPLGMQPRPHTPFNKQISASRQFAWLELPFDEVTEVRKRLGAKVNDMVLAILGGALGRYMRRHGYDTDGVVLRVMCPVSMRRADQHGALGNLISMVIVPVDVGITDPLERLQSVKDAMEQLKETDQAGGLYDLAAAVKALPAPVFAAPWRFGQRRYWPHNITSTNVAGPRTPLYLGPYELLHWYPFGVQWNDNALFLCTLSYREYLILGLVADPTIVTDVWEANDDLRASYEEIAEASKPSPAPGRRLRPAPATPTG